MHTKVPLTRFVRPLLPSVALLIVQRLTSPASLLTTGHRGVIEDLQHRRCAETWQAAGREANSGMGGPGHECTGTRVASEAPGPTAANGCIPAEPGAGAGGLCQFMPRPGLL